MKFAVSNCGWIFDIGFRRFERLMTCVTKANCSRLPVTIAAFVRRLAYPGWVMEPLIVAISWSASRDCRDWLPFVSLLIEFCGMAALIGVHYLCSGMKRIPQFGIAGPRRARWWFEVSGLAAMLCMANILWSVSMPPFFAPLKVLHQIAVLGLFFLFLLGTFVGYLLGLAQRRRIRGYSLEMVNFFFWVIVGSQVLMILMNTPMLGDLLIPILVSFGCVVLVVAGVLALTTRWTRRAHHQA